MLVLVALLVSTSVNAAPLSAHEIMARNEDARKIDDVNSSATLASGGAGETKTKTFSWWRKLGPDGTHFKTLTRFHEPAEVRGEGILFQEREGDQSDVQLYLPAYKKVRRVESQQQSGSFMGSELSYADIATPHVDDFSHKLTGTDSPCEAAGKTCYLIESTPATDATRERTGYSRSLQWIRKDSFMAVRSEYYDLDGKLWKKILISDIREVDATHHKWMACDLRIENAGNGRFTNLKFDNLKINAGIPEATFSQQNLAREN